ncbi:hypothetical protein BC941DRAFT_411473 [Chlamydoabsidia padenii]|nr:hypothetical protein BC941DRAFT_411473 [Chlamydoabsidia padenii]
MVNIYKKCKKWVSRVSTRVKGVMVNKRQDPAHQTSTLTYPSDLTSIESDDEHDDTDYFTPSSSVSDLIIPKQRFISSQSKWQQKQQLAPPSPALTVSDKDLPDIQSSLPKQSNLLSSGSITSTTSSSKSNTTVLDQLALDTMFYNKDTTTTLGSPDRCNDESSQTHGIYTLTDSDAIDPPPPCLLKLAQDVLANINETPPLTDEYQQLEPKLMACLLVYGTTLD